MERVCGNRLVCTCRKPGFRQPVRVTALELVSLFVWAPFVLAGGNSQLINCSQIQHIRHERTWSASSEAERWRHDGFENKSFVDVPPFPSSRELTSWIIEETSQSTTAPSHKFILSSKSLRMGRLSMPSCVVSLLCWVGALDISPTSETFSPLWFKCWRSLPPRGAKVRVRSLWGQYDKGLPCVVYEYVTPTLPRTRDVRNCCRYWV